MVNSLPNVVSAVPQIKFLIGRVRYSAETCPERNIQSRVVCRALVRPPAGGGGAQWLGGPCGASRQCHGGIFGPRVGENVPRRGSCHPSPPKLLKCRRSEMPCWLNCRAAAMCSSTPNQIRGRPFGMPAVRRSSPKEWRRLATHSSTRLGCAASHADLLPRPRFPRLRFPRPRPHRPRLRCPGSYFRRRRHRRRRRHCRRRHRPRPHHPKARLHCPRPVVVVVVHCPRLHWSRAGLMMRPQLMHIRIESGPPISISAFRTVSTCRVSISMSKLVNHMCM
jgi:hypothetical protein